MLSKDCFNVLLLMTDQHRFDALGFMGNSAIKTPNLDRLAHEGTIFRHAYTACPSCLPARASLISGMSQWSTGLLGMGKGQGPIGVNFKHTLPGELAKAGYHTQGVGKMHFYPQRSLCGFHNTVLDESSREDTPDFISDYRQWFNENKDGDYDICHPEADWNGWTQRVYQGPEWLHPTNWTVDESIKFLQRRDPSKPFFLKTSFARPHSPYDAPRRYFDMYKDQALPAPFIGEWADMHNDPETAKLVDGWRGVHTKEEIHDARTGYYGNVTLIDDAIGRLLKYMESIEQLDNTLIIFTSDHGDMLGDHNLWRKTYAYEGSTHIPMVVRLPKALRENKRDESDKPVMLRDIMPTILDVLGVDIPETVEGLSMFPLTQGETCEWRTYAHGEHCTCYSEEQEMQYVTDGKTKFVWLPRLNMEQLFDLTQDPGELRDLSKSPRHTELLKKWRGYLIQELEARNCGMIEGGELVDQKGKDYLSSPHYQERLNTSGFDWLEFRRKAQIRLSK